MITLNKKLKRINVKEFELDSKIVYEYFNNLSESDRSENFMKAIHIGCLALLENRISAFLSKTTNELGTELEYLKIMFDLKQEVFYKSSVKGAAGESEISEHLINFCKNKLYEDKIRLTGTEKGEILRNKTGDIICEIGDNKKIAIECKFDKQTRFGDIKDRDVFANKTDTAWSQLIEAQANRATPVSIMVFDENFVDSSILKFTENVGYIPSIGFICIINTLENDYKNLEIVYCLARDILVNSKANDIDYDVFKMIVARTISTINEILTIKKLVNTNIQNNNKILTQLEKGILLMEANQEYLNMFLDNGTLSSKELLEFYQGKGLKEKLELKLK